MQRRFVHGPGVDEPLVWYEGAGTSDRRWLVQDQLGSVIAVSNASGAALSVNSYNEYGIPGSSNAGRFQYTGQMWLPEAQLYHYKARAYAPSLGRFLQTDPILYAGGMNLYAYVGGDPVNAIDPLGLCDVSEPEPDVHQGTCPNPPPPQEDWAADWRSAMDANTASHLDALFAILAGIDWDALLAAHPELFEGHDYTTTNRVCRAALSDAGQTAALASSVFPGQDPNVPFRNNSLNLVRDRTMGMAPGGFVRSTISGHTGTNLTTPLHVFSGSVDRTIFANSTGTYVTTHGVGTSPGVMLPIFVPGPVLDAINQIHAPQIFNAEDAALAERLAASNPAC
jgi:RHS repeat-associated protein